MMSPELYKMPADDKRTARRNCITYMLNKIPYEEISYQLPDLPEKHERGENLPDKVPFLHTGLQIY